jgi:hypothetical protein
MNVNGMGSGQGMHTQARKMDGSGEGQGQQLRMRKQDGSGEGKGTQALQELPEDSKTAVKDFMESIPKEDRKAISSEISKLDVSSMNTDELLSSIDSITSSYYGTSESAFAVPTYA